jgi:trk system potassium uptake protein TrkH
VPSTTLHVAGTALLFVGIGVMVSAVIEAATGGEATGAMLIAAAITFGTGAAGRLFTTLGRLERASVFAPVGVTWLAVTVFGALPYILARTFQRPGIGWIVEISDAIFESASGFSCTGSTVFGVDGNTIESQGRGILFWRQMTQWLGGMGIVVLVVAVLPALGVGGMGLVTAEAPGESADRLVPRISETARRFWILYVGVTALITLGLLLTPGPNFYDAVSIAFAAAATGGFAPYDYSIGRFDSALVEAVVIAGLFISATNFTLHWRALRSGPRVYVRDSEFRVYALLFGGSSLLIAVLLWWNDGVAFLTALRHGTFNLVSLGSTAGFGSATDVGSIGDFVIWTPAAQLVLVLIMISGGMTGSTSGALKVKRLQIGAGHALRTVRRARRPRAVLPVRVGRDPQAEWVVSRVAGFVGLYALCLVVGTMVVTALGSDLETAIGGVATSMGGVGPGIGEAGPTASFVGPFTAPARMVLALLMIVGRLEIFPILLMFSEPGRRLRSVGRRNRARVRRG